MGEHASGVARQELQQIEFLRREVNLLAAAHDAMAIVINDQIAALQTARRRFVG